MSEREEALLRILVAIFAAIFLPIWNYLMQLVAILHWIYVMITGERNKDLAKFNNYWISYVYRVGRYLGFSTNKRPWPFKEMGKTVEKVDLKP